jgi:hypothetical protein
MNNGIWIQTNSAHPSGAQDEFMQWITASPWTAWFETHTHAGPDGDQTHHHLSREGQALLTPEDNTLNIRNSVQLQNASPEQALMDEILLGLLSSPYPQIFPALKSCAAMCGSGNSSPKLRN